MNEQETAGLLPEWIRQLPADLGRDDLIMHPVMVRKLAFRHPEGSEHQVPQRKGAREIGVAAGLLRGVMPAMKYRRRKHVSERAQRPVQVGVDERRVERGERT